MWESLPFVWGIHRILQGASDAQCVSMWWRHHHHETLQNEPDLGRYSSDHMFWDVIFPVVKLELKLDLTCLGSTNCGLRRLMANRSRLTLPQVMACCLTALCHYLNQCWLIISGVQWLWSGGITKISLKNTYLKFHSNDNELNYISTEGVGLPMCI